MKLQINSLPFMIQKQILKERNYRKNNTLLPIRAGKRDWELETVSRRIKTSISAIF
ncbi:hypothetical protein DSAG12_04070 [Promethearchaeum syntrophicum]|uniref:Uncharacterized protein n=1 Tax=Promethearchaeum syntrophicum TaxID=2594042 RepID=A0AC61ZTW1_9ARCH|nr:hypothetical protein [Candidatus Prometheoarchaeum syntrophicum]